MNTPPLTAAAGAKPARWPGDDFPAWISPMLVKELRKIENKYGKLLRRKQLMQDKVYNLETQLENLKAMRIEYASEVNA